MNQFNFRRWASLIAGIVVFFAGVGQAQADFIPGITFTNATFSNGSASFTAGSAFTVGVNNIAVTALGLENRSFNVNTSLTVRIYQDGTSTDLVTASVLVAGPTSATDPRFNYTVISPLVLNANTKYEIVVDIPDAVTLIGIFSTGVTSLPGVTYDNAVGITPVGGFPTSDALAGGPYFGPTFEFTAVPEPTTWALIGVGAIGASVYAWRKKRLATKAGMAKLKV